MGKGDLILCAREDLFINTSRQSRDYYSPCGFLYIIPLSKNIEKSLSFCNLTFVMERSKLFTSRDYATGKAAGDINTSVS